jgi:hypothetical protein
MINVFWTETALETYFKVIDYLTDNYTDKQVVQVLITFTIQENSNHKVCKVL